MTAKLAIGLLLALASAATLNWGYVVQHGETAQLPPLSLKHPVASLRSLFTNARWLAGFLAGIGGWVMYVGALALAPLSLVQAGSAGGIGLLALLVWRTTGTNLSRREWMGVAIAVFGLMLLGISLAGQRPGGGHGSWPAVGAWMAASLVVAALAAGPGSRLLTAGAGFGIAAGVLYAAGDVGTKAVVGGGIWLIVIPAVLALHGLAFVALQFGFQRGGALATAGVATLFTNALPILAGVVVYHELLPTGALGVLRVIAFAAVILGAAVLARATSSPPPKAGSAELLRNDPRRRGSQTTQMTRISRTGLSSPWHDRRDREKLKKRRQVDWLSSLVRRHGPPSGHLSPRWRRSPSSQSFSSSRR